MKTITKKLTHSAIICLLSTTMLACGAAPDPASDSRTGNGTGSGTGTGTGTGTGGTNNSVEEVLSDLGIDTTISPRLDIDGDTLPEDYAPFGSRQTINKMSEIMLFGVPANDTKLSTAGNRMSITNLVPTSNNRFNWELLHDEPISNTPWLTGFNSNHSRASVAGDFDGDGIDEIFIVYQQSNEDVKYVIMQDSTENYLVSTEAILNTNSWDEIFVSAGDYDGDGSVDVIVGLTALTGGSKLVMLQNDSGSLTLNGLAIDIPKKRYDFSQLAMASGNLDFDNSLELVVAVNESRSHSEYYVFDDANTGFTLMRNEQLVVDNGAGTSMAVVMNVAVGDVDGDSIDEIVLAGLSKTGSIRSSDSIDTYYMVQVLDDAKNNLQQLAETYTPSGAIKLKESAAIQRFNYAQVITADIDGDGAKEIVVNQFVFQSLRSSPFALTLHDDDGDISNGTTEIPFINWTALKGRNYALDWNTSAIAAADVTLDKRENVVIYAQNQTGSTRDDKQQLQVWGLDQINGWSKMAAYDTQKASGTTIQYHPQILLPDLELDDGSATLLFSAGSHQLVFSQPIVIAALAAAPCATDLGQDLGESCRTSYGNASSSSNESTKGWSFTAGGSVGYDGKLPFTNSGLEVVASAQETLRNWTTSFYKLTKTVTRETGAIEDSVILTSIPLDIYNYTVLSHPDQNLVGQTVQVRLPREMITVMVTREFYNNSVALDDPRIDSSVFQHSPGNPASYPDKTRKNQLLNQYDGLQSLEFTTGQGTGQTTATISEFNATSTGNAYEFHAQLDVKATTGVVVGGFNVGGGSDKSLEVTRGSETIYQGSVGNINADAFAQGLDYNWGLFSYFYRDSNSGQTFEVLNYWVD